MRSFLKDRRGNVALIFALSLLPVTVLVGGSVDLSRMRVERTKLQSAVDAASLAASMMPSNSSDAAVQATVDAYIAANFEGRGTVPSARVVRDGTAVEVFATANVPMTFASLLGADTRPVSAHAKAERGGVNVEIAMVLDVTGSMAGTKIRDLRTAATDLIDIVVQDVQSPYYTRMAVVPYSVGVNVGDRADEVRGEPRMAEITAAGWSTGPSRNITNVSKANPARVTAGSHGFQDNDVVYINGVPGMSQINDRAYRIDRINGSSFYLYTTSGSAVNSGSWSNFSNSTPRGTATECLNTGCLVQITAADHGLSDGDDVFIEDLDASGELDDLNGWIEVEDVIDDDNFIVEDTFAWGGTYTSGGEFDCYDYGCENYTFTTGGWWSSTQTWGLSECVSERTGPEAYTDAAPEDYPVGLVYAPNPNNTDCPVKEIMTLTSNRGQLRSHINGLTDGGGTAGHIGIAWGWYMLSPNFNDALDNIAADYDAPETLKVAVIMTDGEFNTSYCNGVQLGQMACDEATMATNNSDTWGVDGDDPFEQAEALCEGMIAEGIVVYTVGFDLAANSQAARFMQDCASDPSNAYLASNGQQLNAAFRAIGDSIGQLRLTR